MSIDQDITIEMLNAEQRVAAEAILNGRDVYIDGTGGTGKTVTVQAALAEMRRQKKAMEAKELVVAACAPTAMAAQVMARTVIGACTAHRLFGFKTSDYTYTRRSVGNDVDEADVLWIDEVSMMRVDMFDAIMDRLDWYEHIGRKRPQLILTGDMMQLSPVVSTTPRDGTSDAEELVKMYGGKGILAGFPFMGRTWEGHHGTTVRLTNCMRATSPEFADALQKLRIGDAEPIEWLNAQCGRVTKRDMEDDLETLLITYRRKDVALRNDLCLAALPGEPVQFDVYESGRCSGGDLSTPVVVKLGMRCRMTRNDYTQGFCNGERGEVIDIGSDDGGEFVCVMFDGDEWETKIRRTAIKFRAPEPPEVTPDGVIHRREGSRVIGTRSQFAIEPFYASTVHKMQGQTIDTNVWYDPSFSSTAEALSYVAVSRVHEPSQLSLTRPLKPNDFRPSQAALDFYSRIESKVAV